METALKSTEEEYLTMRSNDNEAEVTIDLWQFYSEVMGIPNEATQKLFGLENISTRGH